MKTIKLKRMLTTIVLWSLMCITNASATIKTPHPEEFCSGASKAGCYGRSGHCHELTCRAEGCKGDYSSGSCKALKEEHEFANCSTADKNCGTSLPSLGSGLTGPSSVNIPTTASKSLAPTKSRPVTDIPRQPLVVPKTGTKLAPKNSSTRTPGFAMTINQGGGVGGGSSFMACDSESGICYCSSIAECFDMESECKDPGKIKCKKNTSECSCKWKSRENPKPSRVQQNTNTTNSTQ